MQNCPYITIRKKWKLFEFVSGFFWKKINKNRKNTPNRALQIVNLIILFIYQKFSNMHQTMQNCLPINVQRVNRWKIEVVNVFFIDLGPPAQFVRHCRMTVNNFTASGMLRKDFILTNYIQCGGNSSQNSAKVNLKRFSFSTWKWVRSP